MAVLDALSARVRRELLAHRVSTGFVVPRPNETASETLALQRYLAADIDRRIAFTLNQPAYARLSSARRTELLQSQIRAAYENARLLSGKAAAYRLEQRRQPQHPLGR